MPDRSALDFAYTMQGEYQMKADKLRRDARDLRSQADGLIVQAELLEERAGWAGEFAAAVSRESGDTDEQ